MEDSPLVSVLMTVYNREKYIAEAIESVMASTYQNWELVLVDDKSTDRSMEIAKYYQDKDSRIKIFENESNIGDYPNRNKAASHARGKYLKYVDSDDMIYPHGLEQLVYYMEKFPDAGYGLCSFPPDKDQIYPYLLSPREAYQRHYLINSIFHRAPLSSIIKKEAFDEIKGFSGKQHVGDFEIWHLLSKKFPVVMMQQGIVWYREHDDQQMEDNRSDPFVPFKYILLSKQIIMDDSCPLSLEQRKKVLKQLEKKESSAIINAGRSHSIGKALEMLKASDLNLYQVFKNLLVNV